MKTPGVVKVKGREKMQILEENVRKGRNQREGGTTGGLAS